MTKKFSVASWNVRNFSLKRTLKDRVVRHLRDLDPDIFGILEVKGKDVWRYMFREFPNHSFFITEGQQSQEILVGVRNDLRCFLTQRNEFKGGRTTLRPGPFLTVQVGNGAGTEYYSILFLHLKSMADPEGFGLRDDMLWHAFRLKRALDRVPQTGGSAKFLFMGDLNTMGMEYPYGESVDAANEMRRLSGRAGRKKMKVLTKDDDRTWTNGRGNFSDLDHVVASKSIRFQDWNGHSVRVVGWNKLDAGSSEFRTFVNRISDHCALYCEVH